MKILITGHRGFIGGYLTKEFDDYIGLDIKDGNDILNCNLPAADIVIHLAAKPGVLKSMEEPLENARTNILGTIRIAERYKNSRVIFTSSGGTIQETIESPYGLSKLCCEKYIKLLCNDYVILRLPNVYGKNSRSVIDKFLLSDIDIYGDGSAMRTYVHIDDIIRGIKESINWPKGLYKMGSDQSYTVLQIARAMGKPIKFSVKRKGELLYSHLDNTTPNWSATLDAMDYIKNYAFNNNPIQNREVS